MTKRTKPASITESSKCPNCGERRLVPVVYGYPGEDLMRLSQQGSVQLGGCVIGNDDPQLHCSACDHSVWPDGRTQKSGWWRGGDDI